MFVAMSWLYWPHVLVLALDGNRLLKMTYPELLSFLYRLLGEPSMFTFSMYFLFSLVITLLTCLAQRQLRVVMIILSLLTILLFIGLACLSVDTYGGLSGRMMRRSPVGFPFISIFLMAEGIFKFELMFSINRYARRVKKFFWRSSSTD